MTLNGVMAVILRYFTSLLYFVVRVRRRRKESSGSLSHLLMRILLIAIPIRLLQIG